jgi:hypothetical protein
MSYYETAKKRDFRSFWPQTAPSIEPKSIPTFTLARRSFRLNGIVI